MRRSALLRRRGSSLIEVLVAISILSIMVAGILQLFSLALLSSAAAAARTDLLLKCQQVVENIRYCYSLTRRVPAGIPPASSGIPAVLAVTGSPVYLPYDSSDARWDYWGPNGAYVMEQEKGPYEISYTIARSSGAVNALWIITVTAEPARRSTAATRRFFGLTLDSGKRVDYVMAF